MAQHRFSVNDMTCGHCVARIRKAVSALDPAAKIEAELASRTVRIDGDGTGDDYAAAIRDAGYSPTPA